MTPYLNVPFLAEHRYIDFLVQCAGDLDCLHFQLPAKAALDSRAWCASPSDGTPLLAGLQRLPGPKKYALLDNRFHDPELLTSPGRLAPLIAFLEEALSREVVNGLIYTDHYLLQRLADQAPDVAAQLEAVPSVKMVLDSQIKIETLLSYIADTGFRLPGRLTLDSALNRDLDTLSFLALELHQLFPAMRLEVLANEGCLPFCPFKLSRDAYIALASSSGNDRTRDLDHSLGCHRILRDHPHRVLQSPFIRPEDVDLYLYHIDTITVCGQAPGIDFLMGAISAYRNRHHDGNLLDLLNSLDWLAERLYVDNSQLSFDFPNMLSQCDKRCDRCGFCEELFSSIARPLTSPQLDAPCLPAG